MITQEARPEFPLAAPAVLPVGGLYRSLEGLPRTRWVTVLNTRLFHTGRNEGWTFHSMWVTERFCKMVWQNVSVSFCGSSPSHSVHVEMPSVARGRKVPGSQCEVGPDWQEWKLRGQPSCKLV